MLIGIDASRAAQAERTGTENYSLYLIRALLRLDRSNRYVLYFNKPPAEGLFTLDARVQARVMPFPRLWTHLRLGWEVLTRPPEVLFVPSHVLPIVHPRHSVATVHDLGYLVYPEAHTRASRWYLDWSTRFNARTARRLIADSEATRHDLVHYCGTDPAKIVVAYPAGAEGFAPVADPQKLAAVRERYGTGGRYFLYVGTLQPRKNLPTLLRAFGMLAARGAIPDDTRLVLVGRKGWLAEGILRQAREAALGERVVLPGYVAGEDLPALLSGALAYVLPSWYEGFGLPVLEAMACETPVICSNVSSLPEVAGDAALLIDPHDVDALAEAMARVATDVALREELVARGRERVKAFSWEACARQVLATLEAVGAGDGG